MRALFIINFIGGVIGMLTASDWYAGQCTMCGSLLCLLGILSLNEEKKI